MRDVDRDVVRSSLGGIVVVGGIGIGGIGRSSGCGVESGVVILCGMFGGLAVAGNLLCVTHSDVRGRVFLVDLDEQRLMSLWDFTGPDGGYADAGGVAMDHSFAIFVADPRNDVVRHFSPFGKEVGRIGHPPEAAPGAARRDRPGILSHPNAVAVHGDMVHVACGERKLVRGVQRLWRDGRVAKPLRAFGESEGRFGAPRGLWAGDSGILVADTLHGVVQRFTAAGIFVGHFATARAHDEASRPVALAWRSGAEDLLVCDHGDRQGLKRFALGGEPRPLPDGLGERLHEPIGLAVDDQERVYVLDRDGERVQRLHPDLSFDAVVLDLAETLYGS